MKSWICAARAASSISWSVAPKRPCRMLSRMEEWKRNGCWVTTAVRESSVERWKSRTSLPSIVTPPWVGS